MTLFSPRPALAAVLLGTLVLSGCAPASPADDGELTIVASTAVYGRIAEAIAGGHATVTSIVSRVTQDPHSYEATARDQLALSKADIVIENGGGYDPFIDGMLSSLGHHDQRVVLTAVELSGLPGSEDAGHDHGEEHDESDAPAFNEHVWFSLPAMGRLAAALATELAEVDPANAADYRANEAAFAAGIGGLQERVDGIRVDDATAATDVAVTEPVPLYLLEALGLHNRTPAAFTSAIEGGTEVSPAVLLQTLELLEPGRVRLLAYNEQTSGREAEQLVAAATRGGIPVVGFGELPPEGVSYLAWVGETIDAVEAALAASATTSSGDSQ